ncbi:sigma-70 family RNA polymerase sigma factor [Streptomyces sp. NPDC047706]|uniref:sigma-70 family RNA polymerase sigma factor n=1 Tax=Streptomyces sp. NPDC047706 TaxID=3365486 RepID=UPI00371E4A06
MSAPLLQSTTPPRIPVARSAEEDMDLALHAFLSQRKQLLRIAYQTIGDLARAEDVVQETWMRWQRTHRADIQNPAAYLSTATSHLAINVIHSARHRHEIANESQLVNHVDQSSHDPVHRAEQCVSLEEALALLMARLTPAGLAAYVLRKSFDYTYTDLADLLRISAGNARQLVHRAQARLKVGRERPVSAVKHRRLVAAFRRAASTGDLECLTQVLAPEDPSGHGKR